jgi:hypothetical protein
VGERGALYPKGRTSGYRYLPALCNMHPELCLQAVEVRFIDYIN